MTPERLQQLRQEALEGKRAGGHFMPDDVLELFDYIDLVHEDLRLTREERDAEKHKVLEYRLSIGKLGEVLKQRDYEIKALRKDTK